MMGVSSKECAVGGNDEIRMTNVDNFKAVQLAYFSGTSLKLLNCTFIGGP